MTNGRLTATSAVLLVRDVVAAAGYYVAKLGFTHNGFFDEPPTFVILQKDGMHLMLKQADDPAKVVPHWTLSPKLCSVYFWVSRIDDLHREFVARGAPIDYGPCDQPYGCREFGVQDPDGHDISFGEPIRSAGRIEPVERIPFTP